LVLPAAGGPRAVRATGVRTTGADLHRFGVHDEATALAVLARLAERLDQTLAHPLAGHLHQTERRHLGDMVAGPVAAEALGALTQHQVPVDLAPHVDADQYDAAAHG